MTYQQDLTTSDAVSSVLVALAHRVVEDVSAEGRACQRVHLKVRLALFLTSQGAEAGGADP